MTTSKILFVDDEAAVLSVYKRDLGKYFDIHTALGGRQGLDALNREGPFAVVVSDLRMPGMSGIQFFDEASKRFPGTVRIMLTGYADLPTTINAVNEGNIFRFHTKPCSLVDLAKTIKEGIEEHRRQIEIVSENRRLTTERVQIDRDLRLARDEAKGADRAKSEFLAAMSHELRTPLNAVIGFSEVIKSETFGPVGNEQYRDYANDIHDSGQHLLGLINDILELSKIESGIEELYEGTIETPEIVRSAVKLVGHRAERNGIKLVLDLQDPLPALRADERKLKQILGNLLSNAIKFTEAGGKVTLSVWCRRDNGYVFQIADTGIGIAPEDIPKALSRFSQIDGDLSRQYEGAGLGLPLTKALVDQHGGTLDLQSQVGVGTTVTVRFPTERIVELPRDTESMDTAAKTAG